MKKYEKFEEWFNDDFNHSIEFEEDYEEYEED